MKIKFSFYQAFEYLLALALILNCRSIWASLPSISWFSNAVLLVTIAAAAGCIFLKKTIVKGRLTRAVYFVLWIAGYAVFFVFVKSYNWSNFLKLVLVVCVLVIYYFCCNRSSAVPTVVYKYENLILVIAAVSVLFWLLCSVLKVLPATGTVYSNWTGNDTLKSVPSYFGVYFETQYSTLMWIGKITRNTAIFTEGPMASFHFTLALLIELFQKQRSSRPKLILLGGAVLTTISTTGYVACITALALKFFLSGNRKKIMRWVKLLALPIVVIVGGGLVYSLVSNKLATVGSGMVRIDDFVAGFKAWKQHPLFGSGYANSDYIKAFMSSFRSNNTGFSNSPMTVLANGGIYLALPYVAAFTIGLYKAIHARNMRQVCFIAEVLFIFTITIVTYQYIIIFLLIWFAFGTHKKERGMVV